MFSFRRYSELVETTSKATRKLAMNSRIGRQSDAKGKLHELLVGYHLKNGHHMDKHSDDGPSPEETHDKIKSTIDDETYRRINGRAKAAANHIRKHYIKSNKITHVHWTSKAGDIEKATGIKSSQHEDPSDIVITHHHPNSSAMKHTGVSLKVTDKKRQVPVSNPGIASTHGGSEILKKHREELNQHIPALKELTNKKDRKAFLKKHPTAANHVRKKNIEVLSKIADHLHDHLQKAGHEKLVSHLRGIMHANPTPMQKAGHAHVRHTIHGVTPLGQAAKYSVTHIDPASHHEHILNDPANITIHKQGSRIVFKHKNKPFATHRIKMASGADPLSPVKGSGEVHV